MAEKFSRSSLHRLKDGRRFRFTYRPSDKNNKKAVTRCSICNKFMSWEKYMKNQYICYHCGD